MFQFLLICYNKKFFHSRGVTHTFSLSFFQIVPLSLFVFVFVFCFLFSPRSPFHFPLSPPPPTPHFIMTFFALISTAVLLPARFSEIFSFTFLVSSPPLSWNFDFWGLFVPFKLSHMHSMLQRLGKNLIINAKAKIFNIIACSRSFPWF